MISANQIKETLRRLEERYNSPDNTVEEVRLYAKMAILELSGWVEESIDTLVLNIANGRLEDEKIKERFEETVRNTRGFRYERHFLPLLGMIIGLMSVEAVEKSLDKEKQEKFRSALDELSKSRNLLAHTSLQGTQEKIDAPSMTENLYRDIHAGLQEYAHAIEQKLQLPQFHS